MLKKIIKKYFQKGVARNENRRIFAVRNHEKSGCMFFESNEPIKSSLKGKEPFNSKRLTKTGESARTKQKNLISTTIYNEEFDPGSG